MARISRKLCCGGGVGAICKMRGGQTTAAGATDMEPPDGGEEKWRASGTRSMRRVHYPPHYKCGVIGIMCLRHMRTLQLYLNAESKRSCLSKTTLACKEAHTTLFPLCRRHYILLTPHSLSVWGIKQDSSVWCIRLSSTVWGVQQLRDRPHGLCVGI